jgi:hypothetical protein
MGWSCNDNGVPSLLRLLAIISLESTYRLEAIYATCATLHNQLLDLVTRAPARNPTEAGQSPFSTLFSSTKMGVPCLFTVQSKVATRTMLKISCIMMSADG